MVFMEGDFFRARQGAPTGAQALFWEWVFVGVGCLWEWPIGHDVGVRFLQ
jgi:hypothetical protein